MKIESWIDYWDNGFLTYNPEKIRSLLFEHFPTAIFDKTNYSRLYIENFFQNVKEKGLVTFKEAETVFGDSLARIFDDEEHSFDEKRNGIIGHSIQGRLLIVSFTERENDTIRIISARETTPKERRSYENANG